MYVRSVARGGTLVAALASLPVASAHGGEAAPPMPQWFALVVLVAGVAVTIGSGYARRRTSATTALGGAFVGLAVAAIGAIGLVQLSPVESLAASQPPVSRAFFGMLTLGIGIAIVVGSLVIGRMQWPDRPRYAVLGMLLGLWVIYPVITQGSLTNPAGYLLALAVPTMVGYLLWRDGRGLLSRALADRAARWFGAGTGIIAGLFFMFSMGMLTVVPEAGRGVNLRESFITTAQVSNPLVYWPAVEFHFHDFFGDVPLSGVVSVGMGLLVGLVAVLVGLNAALLAYQWRVNAGEYGSVDSGKRANDTAGKGGEATAGTAAVAAPNACCCCGPVLAELTVVAAGPAAAAPLYWLFVDLASPLGALFFVASVALLVGNLVRAGNRTSG